MCCKIIITNKQTNRKMCCDVKSFDLHLFEGINVETLEETLGWKFI